MNTGQTSENIFAYTYNTFTCYNLKAMLHIKPANQVFLTKNENPITRKASSFVVSSFCFLGCTNDYLGWQKDCFEKESMSMVIMMKTVLTMAKLMIVMVWAWSW